MKKILMGLKETAEYLGVKKTTLYSWCHKRKLPYIKIGGKTKFDLAELNSWIEENSVEQFKY